MNLCMFFFHLHREKTLADRNFLEVFWPSLYLQAEWQRRHWEYQIGGNHLLENAAGLAMAGACFAGPDARSWFEQGLRLVKREIPRQILADGTHCNRTPMYHSRVLYILATLSNADPKFRAVLAEVQEKMGDALRRMCHPDGEIALLNDSVMATYNPPRELLDFSLGVEESRSDPPGSFALEGAGFYGARTVDGDYLIIDAGPATRNFNPGHGHGGLFSFELSFRGQRVVVDSGVFDYEAGERRTYCRSTAAHNTVELNGQDQSEYWDAFRVGRRAVPEDVSFQEFEGGFRVSGRHAGYRRLPARAIHERRFTWHHSGCLLLADTIVAETEVSIASRLHLYPGSRARQVSEHAIGVDGPGGEWTIVSAGEGALSLDPSLYCPEFGLAIENQAVVLRASGCRLEFGFCLRKGSVVPGFDLQEGAREGPSICRW